MKLFSELKRAAKILLTYPNQWAVCGGVAASIYRQKARFTDDLDFALIDSPQISAQDLASLVIKTLGFMEYKGFVQADGKQVFALLCARGTDDERFVGLDFLLPVQFWIPDAVKYAQSNMIDYGFAVLPTITPESLILAKLLALTCDPQRYQDIDDIREILRSTEVNLDFVREQIKLHKLELSENLSSLLK